METAELLQWQRIREEQLLTSSEVELMETMPQLLTRKFLARF